MLKVLEILKNFFQEVFKQGLGQSPKVFFYHFYPVAERAQANKSRLTGFGSEQPEFVKRKRLHQNQYHINIGESSPFVKVLESLENFFQEVFK